MLTLGSLIIDFSIVILIKFSFIIFVEFPSLFFFISTIGPSFFSIISMGLNV